MGIVAVVVLVAVVVIMVVVIAVVLGTVSDMTVVVCVHLLQVGVVVAVEDVCVCAPV